MGGVRSKKGSVQYQDIIYNHAPPALVLGRICMHLYHRDENCQFSQVFGRFRIRFGYVSISLEI